MRWLTVLLALAATPALAMTAEDCKRVQATVAKSVPAVNDLRLAPSVTDDGWCRVIDGPLGSGLEWRLETTGADFTLDVRQDRFEFEELGPFALTGQVQMQSRVLKIGPIRFSEDASNGAAFFAEFGSSVGADARVTALNQARLSVGSAGLVDDVLAWAFRQDLTAARSSFIAARDQREFMLDWLNDEALRLIGDQSASAFREIVRAYPRARGTAVLSVADGQSIELGGLVSAVLFGESFSRADAAKLVQDAGLTLTWTPN
jgi:hypothetical protein